MNKWPDSHSSLLLENFWDLEIMNLHDPELVESSQFFDPFVDLFNESLGNDELAGDEEVAGDNDPPRDSDSPGYLKERPMKIPFRRLQPESNHKVAIPRASTRTNWSNRARVFQACKSCQELKAKCSGNRPRCHRCEELGVECSYGERKREITTKKIEELSSQVHILGRLLLEIYPRLDHESAEHVDQSLDKIYVPGLPSLARSNDADVFSTLKGPFNMLDFTQEDFNREPDTQAIGFIGEHSAIAWLYRLKSILEQVPTSPSASPEHFSLLSFSSIDFYQNGCGLDIQEDLSLFERPAHAEANQLISIYFRVIHPSFPIISKTIFLTQYRSFYSSSTARPGKQWLAVLNFMFAIAKMHLPPTPTPETASCDDQARLAYFSRGWILAIDKKSLRDHANLQQVQAEGLATFYLLSAGQVNRAWRSCGIAIRSALAMGLNLRNESQIPLLSKEIRYRVWWALYLLDNSLSGLTGRPPSVSRLFCTTPLPIPFEEETLRTESFRKYLEDESSRRKLNEKLLSHVRRDGAREWTDNDQSLGQASRKRMLDAGENATAFFSEYPPLTSSLCFWYEASLSMLMREAIETLYVPSGAQKQWVRIEVAISSLNTKIDALIASLPSSYAFQTVENATSLNRHSARFAFQFFYTKILITQPCLGQLFHTSQEVNSLEPSHESIPAICIQSAIQLIKLLPDQPNLDWLYGLFPWWSALQYIIQAVTIMLTGSFLRSRLGSLHSIDVSKSTFKAKKWLMELCQVHYPAYKAWLIYSDMISSHARRLGFPDS